MTRYGARLAGAIQTHRARGHAEAAMPPASPWRDRPRHGRAPGPPPARPGAAVCIEPRTPLGVSRLGPGVPRFRSRAPLRSRSPHGETSVSKPQMSERALRTPEPRRISTSERLRTRRSGVWTHTSPAQALGSRLDLGASGLRVHPGRDRQQVGAPHPDARAAPGWKRVAAEARREAL